MSDNKYVLAMYDVRGKQEFIFRTNKLQEIVGGSWIIRDIFKDYLFECAKIFDYQRDDLEGEFSPERFEKRINEGYDGEVVYEGGGNFLVLFKDMETFRNTSYKFTKLIMKKIGTLKVLGTAVEIDGFNDFSNDRNKLYKEHRKNEAQESNIAPWSCLPIVQVDRKTTQPLVEYDYPETTDQSVIATIQSKGVHGKLSKESTAKLLKFHSEMQRIKQDEHNNRLSDLEKDFYKNEKLLDKIVDKKGEDSKLAVIYIDGNNMGAKSQDATKDKKSYDDCVNSLRKFSYDTQKVYVEEGIKKALEFTKNDKNAYRIVVSAGDEINFIVKAKDAFKCAENYLNYLKEKDNASACAGIAVFHSHSPYADAYRIAEEACESGKQKMKAAGLENASFIDFHICQGATGTSLEDIRSYENGEIISQPWLMWEKKNDNKKDVHITYYSEGNEGLTVKEVIDFLNAFSRTNVKGLASAAKESKSALVLEINRIYAHGEDKVKKKVKNEKQRILDELNEHPDDVRGLFYDISIAYDLWLKNEPSKTTEGNTNGKN